MHDTHTTCLKCFPWCYYTIIRQVIPMARSYQYQWLFKISSKYSLEFTLCSELEFGCEMSWNWVLLKVNTCDSFNFRLISLSELKDSHAEDRSLLSNELFSFASGNNHSNMLSPQDKDPIFNDMKCHCGVYSSFSLFLKSWIDDFGGLETCTFLAHFSDIGDHFIALFGIDIWWICLGNIAE